MMMTPPQLFFLTTAAFAFVFGTLIGSFLNVVIYRVPAGKSIISPGSACGTCGHPVRWYDNIPILSWLILGGKCRDCEASISPRYMVVEALTGFLAVALWYQLTAGLWNMATFPDPSSLTPTVVAFFLRFTFASLLVAITFVDLDHLLVPHEFTLPGIALGLATPWILQALLGPYDVLRMWPPVTPWVSLIGAIGGFVVIIGIFYLYLAIRGVEGIGGGDATLMALVGAWLGWPSIIFVLFAASFQGIIAAAIAMVFLPNFIRDSADIFDEDDEVSEDHDEEQPSSETAPQDEPIEDLEASGMRGKAAVPFGPFICLAAVEYLLFGPYLPPELSLVYMFY